MAVVELDCVDKYCASAYSMGRKIRKYDWEMSGEFKEDDEGLMIVAQDTLEYMQKTNNTKIDRIIVKGSLIDDIVSFKFRNDFTSVDVDFIGINSVV